MSAPAGPAAPIAPLRNCWTCVYSGPLCDGCNALTLDVATDQPVLDWLDAVGMGDDGTVPAEADGCPAWAKRWRE